MKVFITYDSEGYINSYHTSSEFTAFTTAEQEIPTIDITKLQGYKIEDGKLIFDETQWSDYVAKIEKEQAIQTSNNMMEDLMIQNVLKSAIDAEAYTMRYLYPIWSGKGVKYKKDDRFMYNDKFYKVLQEHTSQEEWKPDTASSLYVEISDPNVEYSEWKQPSHAEDAYNIGDKVTYNGKKYKTLINANTWSPEAYPAGWEEIV